MNPHPGTKPRLKRRAKRISAVLLGRVLAPGGYGLYPLATDHFHAVIAGQVYRSGRMSGDALARVIQGRGIKSGINLRGGGGLDGWHREETNTAQGGTAAKAGRALNPFYGHIPHLHWRYSSAMDRSDWRYASNHPAPAKLTPPPQPVFL